MKKQDMRKRLALLSFSEKVAILKKLRDRSLAIAAGGLRAKSPAPKKTASGPARTSQSREPHP